MTSRLPVFGKSRSRTVSRSVEPAPETAVLESNTSPSPQTSHDLICSQTSESSSTFRGRSGTIDLGNKPIVSPLSIEDEIVTVESEFSSHLGGRVLVGGQKVGILRFFGYVHVREGLYCGVQLLEPAGNHDGVLKGKRYFQCPPNHGIFAPAAKVELLLPQLVRKDNNPLVTSAYSPVLTSSMMDSINTTPEQNLTHSISQQSSEGSQLSSPHPSPRDANETSNEFESIMDVEPPSFLLSSQCQTPAVGSREDIGEEEEGLFDNILEPMDLDSTREYEVVTPNSGSRPVLESQLSQNDTITCSTTSIPPDDPMTSSTTSKLDPPLSVHNGPVDPHIDRPISSVSGDTGYHGDSDYAEVRSTASPLFDTSNEEEKVQITNQAIPQEERIVHEDTDVSININVQVDSASLSTPGAKLNETFDATPTPKRPPKSNVSTGNKRAGSGSSSTSRPPKKGTGPSPASSTRNLTVKLEPPPPPKPRPPKPISKQQLIMEQLKASMKNDKNKPPVKAEIKSKVMQEIKTDTKRTDSTTDESVSDMPGDMGHAAPVRPRFSKLAQPKPGLRQPMKRAMPTSSTASKRQPLRPTNSSLVKLTAPITQAKGLSKATSKTSSSSSIASAVHSTSTHKHIAAVSKTRKVDGNRSASASTKPSSPPAPSKTCPKETAADRVKRLETQLVKQKQELINTRTAVDVLSVTTRYYNEQVLPKVLKKTQKTSERIKNDAKTQVERCKNEASAKAVQHEEKLAEMQQKSANVLSEMKQSRAHALQTLVLAHEKQIKRLEEQHKEQLKLKDQDIAQTEKDHKELLASAKHQFEDQMNALKMEHDRNMKDVQTDYDKDVSKLQNDLEVVKLKCDKYKKEQQKLEQELMRDADSKIKSAEKRYENMHKEMCSLEAVLEVRNSEIKHLRPQAEMLPIVQREIEGKDKEINKLTQQIAEIKERFEQQRNAERSMRMDYENMTKSVQKMQNDLDNTALERDELLDSMRCQTSDEDCGASPQLKNFPRVRSSHSESEPGLSTPAHHSANTSHMVRSAISHHQEARRRQQKGRAGIKQNGVEVHMYPQGGRVTTSLIYDINDDVSEEHMIHPESLDKASPIGERGRGVSSTSPRGGTVDSGIFTSTYSDTSSVHSNLMTNSTNSETNSALH